MEDWKGDWFMNVRINVMKLVFIYLFKSTIYYTGHGGGLSSQQLTLALCLLTSFDPDELKEDPLALLPSIYPSSSHLSTIAS